MGNSIVVRLVVTVVAIVVLAVSLVGGLSASNILGFSSDVTSIRAKNAANRVLSAFDLVARQAQSASATLSVLPSVRQALQGGTTQANVYPSLKPVFELLKNQEGISQMHIHTADAHSWLRVDTPAKYGDDLSAFRRMVVQCNRDRTPLRGMESGVNGVFLRGINPVYSESGQHLGSVEVGWKIDDALLAKVKAEGVNYVVYARDKDNRLVSLASTWADRTVPVRMGFDHLAEAAFGQVNGSSEDIPLDIDGKSYISTIVPVPGFDGKPVGMLHVAVDVTSFSHTTRLTLLTGAGAAAAVTLLAVLLTTMVSRRIVGPVGQMTRTVTMMANGNLEVEVPATGLNNELGDMARAIEVFRQAMVANAALQAEHERAQEEHLRVLDANARMQKIREQEQEERLKALADQARLQAEHEREQEARLEHSRHLQQVTMQFDRDIGDLIDSLAAATSELHATAGSMSSIAEQTSKRAGTVSRASEDASGNVATVAAAAEELTASIQEIGRQVSASSEITTHATTLTRQARGVVVGLSDSSKKIGEVIGLIAKIASQTNLLALNATIEAARAGDAGKGFAVVANEVRNLATQTRGATDDITRQVHAIQEGAQAAVSSISEIARVVEEVNTVAAAISEAVSEQDSATREIAQNISLAADGTQNVSRTIQDVTQAADETGLASGEVLAASQELASQTASLQELVASFLDDVRREG